MSTFALSDIHGYYDLYQQVNNFLKDDDIVYFLGDASDRGPDGWKALKAIASNPKFIYLLGNHEHMLLHAMREYLIGEQSDFYPDGGIVICTYNGGYSTLEGWKDDGMKEEWITFLNHLHRQKEYVNKNGDTIHLSHAGYAPGVTSTADDLIWNRRHFNYEWPEGENYEKLIIVHGHTPVQYLNNGWVKEDGIMTYCDGHKIDIDCGTYETKMTCLLDLDTFEEHYFSID